MKHIAKEKIVWMHPPARVNYQMLLSKIFAPNFPNYRYFSKIQWNMSQIIDDSLWLKSWTR